MFTREGVSGKILNNYRIIIIMWYKIFREFQNICDWAEQLRLCLAYLLVFESIVYA